MHVTEAIDIRDERLDIFDTFKEQQQTCIRPEVVRDGFADTRLAAYTARSSMNPEDC